MLLMSVFHSGTELKSDLNDELYEKLYENFVEEVDAVDNGIEHSDGQPRFASSS